MGYIATRLRLARDVELFVERYKRFNNIFILIQNKYSD